MTALHHTYIHLHHTCIILTSYLYHTYIMLVSYLYHTYPLVIQHSYGQSLFQRGESISMLNYQRVHHVSLVMFLNVWNHNPSRAALRNDGSEWWEQRIRCLVCSRSLTPSDAWKNPYFYIQSDAIKAPWNEIDMFLQILVFESIRSPLKHTWMYQ